MQGMQNILSVFIMPQVQLYKPGLHNKVFGPGTPKFGTWVNFFGPPLSHLHYKIWHI